MKYIAIGFAALFVWTAMMILLQHDVPSAGQSDVPHAPSERAMMLWNAETGEMRDAQSKGDRDGAEWWAQRRRQDVERDMKSR
jgi:hypothetical protein